jgi:hypothetical protein
MAVDITINETIDVVDITVNPNIIEVNVTRTSGGGGGGSQTLAQTLDLGNETGGENIIINTADAIELENTSLLKKGTYDFGGNGGISRICSNQYEDMWQNGFRHVFDQSGFIRNSSNGFDAVPDSSFDVTLRFKVGSFWSLDNGTTYICTDNTEGAAEWELYSVGATPTLQEVTDKGNTTDNDIIVRHSTDNDIIISSITDSSQISVNQGTAGITLASQEVAGVTEALIQMTSDKGYNIITEGAIQLTNSVNNNSIDLNDNGLAMSTLGVNQRINLSNGVDDVSIKTDLITEAGLEQQLPDKSGTFAMLDDVPTKTSDLINDGDNGTSHFISLEDLPSTLTLYPTTVASGIGGYNKLVSSITDPDYNTTAVDVTTGAITGTDQLIAGLITDANQIVGNPGIFNMTTLGNIRKTNGSGAAEFFFRVYKRDAGGTETLILQSDNTQQITSAIYAEFNTSGLWNDGVFISTDRIVIKFYGTKVGGGSNPTYDFKFGGTNPVRSIVPVPLTVIPVLSLDELTNVTITGVTNNQLLSYTSATDIWENKTIIEDSIANGVTDVAPSQNAVFDSLALKQNNLKTFNRTQGIYYFEEFIGGQAGSIGSSYGQVITIVSGTGAACTTTNTILNKTNQQGVVRHTTGTLLNGNAGFALGSSSLFIGQGAISLETYVTIETLSNATERFFTFFGYGIPSNWQNNANAIFFSYDEGGAVNFASGAASPNFKCYTKLASVTTLTTTSVPVVASQWYKLRIDINNAGNSVGFYIDGVLVATHTTNIPATTTGMSVVNIINKTVGTTARTMQTDYFMYEEIFTNPR